MTGLEPGALSRKKWDPGKHPRGKGGRWARKADALDHLAEAQDTRGPEARASAAELRAAAHALRAGALDSADWHMGVAEGHARAVPGDKARSTYQEIAAHHTEIRKHRHGRQRHGLGADLAPLIAGATHGHSFAPTMPLSGPGSPFGKHFSHKEYLGGLQLLGAIRQAARGLGWLPEEGVLGGLEELERWNPFEKRRPHGAAGGGQWVSALGPDPIEAHAADNKARAADLRKQANWVGISADAKAFNDQVNQPYGQGKPRSELRSPAPGLLSGAADDFEAGDYAGAASKLDRAYAETRKLYDTARQWGDYGGKTERRDLKPALAAIAAHRERAHWAAGHLPDQPAIAAMEAAAGMRSAQEWVEALHPRDPHGEFARKPGGGQRPPVPFMPAREPAREPVPSVGELASQVGQMRREFEAERERMREDQARQMRAVTSELRAEQSRLGALAKQTESEEHRKELVKTVARMLGLVAVGLLILATAGAALPPLAIAGVAMGPLLGGEAVIGIHAYAQSRRHTRGPVSA